MADPQHGGPTDDKPTVTLTTPQDPNTTSAFLNVRVADIHAVDEEWTAKGAEFLTEPKDHGREIRAYVCDPDGHLIEAGQSTGIGGSPPNSRATRTGPASTDGGRGGPHLAGLGRGTTDPDLLNG